MLREATLNSSILNRLLFEKELILLEIDKSKEPWFRKSELFVEEIILPNRFSIVSLSIILGLILGTIYSSI